MHRKPPRAAPPDSWPNFPRSSTAGVTAVERRKRSSGMLVTMCIRTVFSQPKNGLLPPWTCQRNGADQPFIAPAERPSTTKCRSSNTRITDAPARAFLPHARAKKLPRAAECLVYSLTPSGVLAENHPKNRGFVGILRGQKCLKRRFSRRSPVGEWSRGALDASGFLAGVAAVSRPRSAATATMQLYFPRSGSSRDTVLQNQVERAA